MEFDPGDGSGYRTISAGSIVSVSYQEGDVELKMRVTLEDGNVLRVTEEELLRFCHSRLVCAPEGIKLEGLPPMGDDSCLPGKVENFSHISGNALISARASVFYAKSNPSQSIKKPFVVVEGFDPVDLVAVKEWLGISLSRTSVSAIMIPALRPRGLIIPEFYIPVPVLPILTISSMSIG